jgi:hypothetical protein
LGDFFTNSSGHPDTERVLVKAKHGKNQFVGLALVHMFRVIFGNDSSRIETGSKTNGCRSRRPDGFAKKVAQNVAQPIFWQNYYITWIVEKN